MKFSEVKTARKNNAELVAKLDEIVGATEDALTALDEISRAVSALRMVLSADKHFYEGDAIHKNHKPRVNDSDEADKRVLELMQVASKIRSFVK